MVTSRDIANIRYWSDTAEQAGPGAGAAAGRNAPERRGGVEKGSATPGAGAGISWHHVASALRSDAPFDTLNEGSGIVAPSGVACAPAGAAATAVAVAGADATPRLRISTSTPRPLAVRWACSACGYKNKEAQVVCGVCDTRAPDPSRRSFDPWSCASVGPILRPLM